VCVALVKEVNRNARGHIFYYAGPGGGGGGRVPGVGGGGIRTGLWEMNAGA